MKIAIVNLGIGNLGSVRRAFEDIGAEVFVADDPPTIHEADGIVLPGVGAFTEGMARLVNSGWPTALNEAVLQQRKPLLGICLGMHLLATTGHEGGETKGLGFIPGNVRRLDALGCNLRIPHMGWNEVKYRQNDALVAGIPDSSDFYFVHSYAFVLDNQQNLVALSTYDCEVAAIVRHGNIFACQFHPEKSSKAGRRLLKNFMEYSGC